ncbi:MAG TPA: poly-beta-1,6-N-acetyl-D-glucosamine biosynthesis protein PgaD [Chromatiales bacterium]|nr:poly-beta-1,6-N-acetyl-D-glucosamine biosynthesis protein PgaD [Chromatiales bacterium]
MNPHIIQRPDMQTLRQRFGYSFLTFLFWVIWFYLWIPLLSLAGWLFGVDIFYDEMVVQEGLQTLLDLLGLYFLVIFLISATLGIWAAVNLWRFRGKERRSARVAVDDASLADDFGVTTEQVAYWRQSRRLLMSHDEQGNIITTTPQEQDR